MPALHAPLLTRVTATSAVAQGMCSVLDCQCWDIQWGASAIPHSCGFSEVLHYVGVLGSRQLAAQHADSHADASSRQSNTSLPAGQVQRSCCSHRTSPRDVSHGDGCSRLDPPIVPAFQTRSINDGACTDPACVHLCAKQDMVSAIGLHNWSLQLVRSWPLQFVRKESL